jgi:hypothetical protein
LIDRHRRINGEEQRVAVRRCLGDRFCGDDVVSSGTVINKNRLPRALLQSFRKQAGEKIRAAASRKRYDDADCF